MKDLYLSELRRFRKGALLFTAAHLLALLFVNCLFDLQQQRWEVHAVLLMFYCLAGAGFAVFQLLGYSQPSRWLWLHHRPLSRARIFGAIALASLTLIVLAVGLPAVAALAGIGAVSERTVDARHYLAALHIVLITFAAWLAGAIAVTSRAKTAIVVMVLPALLMAHMASGATMLAPALLCIVLLAWVACSSFKPNRMAPPDNPAALIATALPLQLGLYFALLWSGATLYQTVLMAADLHPTKRALPIAGSYVALTRMGSGAAFEAVLARSTDARADQWRRQLTGAPAASLAPLARNFPVRQQSSNRKSLQWGDGTHKIEWTFSHDAMRFRGRDMFTGRSRGWFGAGGAGDSAPFSSVPLVAAPYLLTPQTLYLIEAQGQQLHRLIELGGAETLTGPPKALAKHQYLLTNRRLIVCAVPADAHGALAAQFGVDLPGPLSELDRVDIAELPDGVLLSFNQGRGMGEGGPAARQTLVFVDATGAAQVVAQRAVDHDFSTLFEHRAWWLSPVIETLVSLPERLLDGGAVADALPAASARPPTVLLAALAASLLSAVGAHLWLRRARIDPRRRGGWLAACLLLGPPALLSLMLLEARAARRPHRDTNIARMPGLA